MVALPATSLPRRRRILYITDLAPHTSTAYRLQSLRRLNQDVEVFDTGPYTPRQRLLRAAYGRLPLGPMVARINRDLRRVAAAFKPDAAWFDKPTLFNRTTMHAFRQRGTRIVFYVQDSPFGPRNDGIWRQFYRVYQMADLHCLFRKSDVARYSGWGLPWIKTIFSFDLQSQFPPHDGWSDSDRDRRVSYIGHPHEDRPAFLVRLAREFNLPVSINGNNWQQLLAREQPASITVGPHLPGDAYREAIWRSRINLSFVTQANEDDIAHKAVETAACAGFLLALRTEGHQEAFEEDKEAVFFSSIEECADKSRFYLSRPDLREAIGRRARERAVHSGYDNDSQLSRILNGLDSKVPMQQSE